MKKALVAGATGLIGELLVLELIRSGQYNEIRIITRRQTKYHDEHLVLEYIIDFDKIDQYDHLFHNIDDVFVCLGTTMKKAKSKKQFMKVDYTYPIAIGKLGLENDVKQYVIVSSIGADRDSRFFYSKVKGKTEEKLISMMLPSIHIFRPSLLVGDRGEFRLGEKAAELVGRPFSLLLIGPLEKYKPVKGTYLAKAMCTVAQEDSSGVHIYESDQILRLGKILNNDYRRSRHDGTV
ncbi:NAD(P)H-binding protein [Evansella sp. AB-rgal1]|uniref:NAD(P)H-binding protein n=1 Tax=Evansella sp. AB-rgal1 TaxID=3242696 RepID=UPI00359CE006